MKNTECRMQNSECRTQNTENLLHEHTAHIRARVCVPCVRVANFLYSVFCILNSAFYILYSSFCILYFNSVFCILYSAVFLSFLFFTTFFFIPSFYISPGLSSHFLYLVLESNTLVVNSVL